MRILIDNALKGPNETKDVIILLGFIETSPEEDDEKREVGRCQNRGTKN